MSQISTKSQKTIDQLLVVLIFVGLIVIWFSLFEAQWIRVALGVLLIGISGLLLRTRIRNRVQTFSEKYLGQMEVVREITISGFKVYKFKDQSTSLHQWREINEVVLKNETDLVFKFQNNKEKVFEKSTAGYYELLKKIPPEKLIDTKIKSYQQTTFENLETCVICGYIAFKKTTCLSCRTDSFATVQYAEETNEAEYLREEQLEYFSTDTKGESVEFYPKKKKDDIFDFDKNWKPIVTESEVIKFSEENYWD